MTTSPVQPTLNESKQQSYRIAGMLLGIAAVWYLAAEAVAAAGFPSYSYVHNFISDLGVPGVTTYQGRQLHSQLPDVMNAGFIGQGALFALAAVVLWSERPRGRSAYLVLAVIFGFGISLAALVHGGEAGVDPALLNLHVAGATMATVGGNTALIVAGASILRRGSALRVASIILGVVGLVAVFMLIVTQSTSTIVLFDYGVWERAAVYAIILWQILMAAAVVRSSNQGVFRA